MKIYIVGVNVVFIILRKNRKNDLWLINSGPWEAATDWVAIVLKTIENNISN